MADDAVALLADAARDTPPEYRVYARRWWLAAVFSVLSCLQCCVWSTYGPISSCVEREDVYGWGKPVQDLFAAYGCIVFVPVGLLVAYAADNVGIRATVLAGAAAEALATGLRLVSLARGPAYGLVTACQLLNAAVGPVVMILPPKLSAVWFPPTQRATATAVTSLANGLGSGFAFALPFLMPNCATAPAGAIEDGLRRIYWLHFGTAVAVLAAVCAYFPEAPPRPPSATSVLPRLPTGAGLRAALCRNRAFAVLALAYGLSQGVYAAWDALLSLMVAPTGVGKNAAALLGLGACLSGIAAGVAVGAVADRLRTRHKRVVVALFAQATLGFSVAAWAAAAGSGLGWIAAGVVVGEVALSGMSPLLYELSVELTYPVGEGVSAALLTIAFNVGTGIALAAQAVVSAGAMTVALPVTCGVCAVVFFVFVAEDYKRLEAEGALTAAAAAGGDAEEPLLK